ncbi:glycoside hydrolase family 79 protein [Rickenella mellea]|uniref:Glycoside hydrolase family 79 protein n=1 Tax=Rickenella mellea TaxID=50990 RepID=A0A4R5XDS5_9AGAM|nr:glycoside hydrolase family 79 protein [Rickenella mellea]
MISPAFLSVVLLACLSAVQAQNVPVSVPLTAPSAAATVKQSLMSFSIEQDRWTDWVGTTTPNTFFINSLNNLKQRSGVPPAFRIGADSEDRTNFNAKVDYCENVFPGFSTTTPYPEASNNIVGDKYYQVASHLPSGTRIIWGVNFGSNNITAAYLAAKSLQKAFSSSTMKNAGVSLDFIEIGNEADFYGGNGDRTGIAWNIAEYTKEWTTFATNISAAANMNSLGIKFMGGGFANSDHKTFAPQGLFSSGIQNSAAGKLITSFSQHHYSGSFCSGSGGLLQDLMTKATIRSNVSIFASDVVATRAKGLDYILGETNSYSCHGAPGVSNVAGAALWALDYMLYSSQIGVSQVYFHQGVGYKYSFIQPATLTRSILDGSTLSTPLAPHLQPTYYAALVATEAIGTSGSTKAVELSINDPRIAGYAFFENGTLKRAVLINSEAFFTTTTTPRTSKVINLSFSGSGSKPKTMTVKRLAIKHADDDHGLTWGGQTFETNNALPSGAVSVQTVNASAGVTISATEVVLLSFQ